MASVKKLIAIRIGCHKKFYDLSSVSEFTGIAVRFKRFFFPFVLVAESYAERGTFRKLLQGPFKQQCYAVDTNNDRKGKAVCMN